MKIALYTGSNGDTRALANRARNLAELWPDAAICTKPAELKGADVVFNQMIDQIEKVAEQRRFVGCGPQVCLFAANVAELGAFKTRQLLHHLEHTPIVVHSPFHLKEVRGLLDAFSAGYRRTLERNLHFIPGGLHPCFTDAGQNDPRRWVVPYNRFNQSQKRMHDHAAITAKALHLLRGEPITVDYYLRHVAEELAGATTDLSLYTVQECPPTREAYADNARQTGMFLSTAAYESFGMMYLELLLSGNVGVFVDYPWVRELLPHYPFICSKANAPQMLASVYRDYAKASAYVRQHTIPYIQSQYRFDAFASRLRTLLESTARTTKETA